MSAKRVDCFYFMIFLCCLRLMQTDKTFFSTDTIFLPRGGGTFIQNRTRQHEDGKVNIWKKRKQI